jgi:NAD(P)-dependent dehydrogenase (short-subunit alcohol dehydrogenase family)
MVPGADRAPTFGYHSSRAPSRSGGGDRRVGRATSREFARPGAHVALLARGRDGLEARDGRWSNLRNTVLARTMLKAAEKPVNLLEGTACSRAERREKRDGHGRGGWSQIASA